MIGPVFGPCPGTARATAARPASRQPTHRAGAWRGGCAVAVLLLAGCPEKRVARPYPPPTAEQLVAHLTARAARIRSLRAESKVDYLAEKGERVKVGMSMLVENPARLRLEANSPFGGSVATLATDGREFELLDVRGNRFLVGEAQPCNIARLIRVELRPEDVVAVVKGAAPLLEDGKPPATAAVAWDGRDGGREVLTLRSPSGATETVQLDAKEGRWDVVGAELRGPDGKVRWRLKHADFSTVGGERLPDRTTIEQPARSADARIRYKDRELNPSVAPTAFHLDPPAGLPVEQVRCD